MARTNTNDVLNRMLVIHLRSLPMYLSYAKPHNFRKHPHAVEALEQIVAGQQRTIDRLANFILENGGSVAHGEFPMVFTALHDLSFGYLMRQAVLFQRRDIEDLEQCVDQLRLSPLAHSTAAEALGAAKGHLDTLEELAAETAGVE